MTTPLLTASKVGLLLECGYSFRADVAVVADTRSSDAADRGTLVHGAIHACFTDQPVSPEVSTEDEPRIKAAVYWAVAASKGKPRTSEVAYELSRDGSVRILGTGREAYVNASSGTICGTADFVAPGLVVDWKTGEHGAREAEPQMLALAAMAIGDGESIEWRAVYLPEHGDPRVLAAGVVTREEAVAIRAGLFEAYDAAQSAEPTPGEHCAGKYCPLNGKCPAFTEAVEVVSAELIPVEALVRRKLTDPIETAEQAVERLAAIALIEKWIQPNKNDKTRGAKAEARAVIAAAGTCAESATHVVTVSQQTRGGLNGEMAYNLAEKYGAQPHELAACLTSTSYPVFRITTKKSALEAAPKKCAPKKAKSLPPAANDADLQEEAVGAVSDCVHCDGQGYFFVNVWRAPDVEDVDREWCHNCDGTGEDQSATQRLEPRLQSLLTDLQRAAQDDWSMQPKYAARYWAEDVERMLDLCTAANKITKQTTNEEPKE